MWNMLKRGMDQSVDEESENENKKMAVQSGLENLLRNLKMLEIGSKASNLLKRDMDQSVDEESKNENKKMAVQSALENLLKDLKMLETGPRLPTSSHTTPFNDKRSAGGNTDIFSGLKIDENPAHLNSGRFDELLGSLNSQAKRHENVNQMDQTSVPSLISHTSLEKLKEQALKNALHESQESKWAASVNGLFKKDGADSGSHHLPISEFGDEFQKKSELSKVTRNIRMLAQNNAYFPMFKKSGQDQYFPLFKRGWKVPPITASVYNAAANGQYSAPESVRFGQKLLDILNRWGAWPRVGFVT